MMRKIPEITAAILIAMALLSCGAATEEKAVSGDTTSRKSAITIKTEAANPFRTVDASPMDMSYFPEDFAKTKTGDALPVMRIIYSRPQVKGRPIFGGILQYGKVWRLGANEATEIEFFQPVSINDKTVKPGRYILYCIPEKTVWTIVFNKDIYSWGLTSHTTKDVERFTAPVLGQQAHSEYFTAVFSKTDNGADLVLAWGEWVCRLPIRF